MKQQVYIFLQHYSTTPVDVDRLIVSAFLKINKIKVQNNDLIKSLCISKSHIQEFKSLKEFITLIESEISNFDLEELIELFEFVISPSDRIINGAIYTPTYIREYISSQTLKPFGHSASLFKVADISCGCGGFLLSAARQIKEISDLTYEEIFLHNIYGLDIQEYAIKRSEILLSLSAIIEGEDINFKFNLFTGNALDFSWRNNIAGFNGFNVVIGNPPYVCSRNIGIESKKFLQNWHVCSTGHPDLYIPFFEIGISLLKEEGKLGYITMNTFFKSINGRALRQYFQEMQSNLIILDFGALQIFNSKSTYTCVCFLEKIPSENLQYLKIENLTDFKNKQFTFNKVPYTSLSSKKGWNLQEAEIINSIESIGTPLGEKFKSRNGIATLKNTVYVFDPKREDANFYYLNSEGTEYKIERDACVDVVNPNKLINTDSIDNIRKKIIFPYSIRKGKIIIIGENQLSASYPFTYEYLSSKKDVLATRDKGKGEKYDVWYQFGRNQSLEPYSFKLFFPHISPHIPNYVINDEPDLLFVNGIAIVSDNLREIKYLKKILSSRLFWFYITNSSKPYGSGYFSLSRNYIKNFGIYDFDEQQIEFLIETEDQIMINKFLEKLYGINLETVVQRVQVRNTDA